jgi:hypothetical protein
MSEKKFSLNMPEGTGFPNGNTYPACGGCLWTQGVIQCP